MILRLYSVIVILMLSGCVLPKLPVDKYEEPGLEDYDGFSIIKIFRADVFPWYSFELRKDIDVFVNDMFAKEIEYGKAEGILYIKPGISDISVKAWMTAPYLMWYGQPAPAIRHNFKPGQTYKFIWRYIESDKIFRYEGPGVFDDRWRFELIDQSVHSRED